MRELLTGDDIFANVMMLRSHDSLGVLLVEGDRDSDALGPHVDATTTRLIQCQGVRNLDRAIELVDARGLTGVLAIRDRDWFGVTVPEPSSGNVVLTDLYDLDATVILKTDVGRRVAIVFGHAATVQAHCTEVGAAGPTEVIGQVAGTVGALRLLSEQHGLELALRDFPIHEVLDTATAAVDLGTLVRLAVARSQDCPAPVEDVIRLASAGPSPSVPTARLCSGHDLAASLSSFCRSVWGGTAVRRELILQAIRSALSCPELRSLEIYVGVLQWETATGFRVWSCRPDTVAAGS